MNGALFAYSLLIPSLVLLASLYVMVRGIVRYEVQHFRTGQYLALVAFGMIACILLARYTTGVEIDWKSSALFATGFGMFVAACLSIGYHTVHKVLPDFFVNSSLVCSVSSLLVIGVILGTSMASTADENHRQRFVESQQYQTRQAHAHATYASQVSVRPMSQ